MLLEQSRPWLLRYLYTSAVTHLVIGLVLPWVSGLGVTDVYHQIAERHFWSQAAPDAARHMQVWWLSLFGPTLQTVGVWMWALTYLGDKHRNHYVWLWYMAGVLLWAPQDAWISLQAEVMPNVWIDCAAIVLLIPPLLCLWVIDHPARVSNA